MTSPSARRRLLPWALTVVFVLVTGLVIVSNLGDGEPPGPPFAAQPDPDPQRHPCLPGAPKPEINMVASTEKTALLEKMAVEKYNGLPDGCARVNVEGIPSGEAAAQLRDVGRVGTRPADVWSPASSVWIGVAKAPNPDSRAASRALGVVPDFGYSVAKTPLVFAVPRATAASIGWPNTERGWTDLPVSTLGKTNPLVSTSGLFALLSTLRATPGMPAGLDLAKVSDPRADQFARSIEGRVAHYGNSELEFLGNLAAAPPDDPTYAAAVPVEEKSVWDYNHRNTEGLPALQSPDPRPEGEQLAALTPSGGTYYSDSPFLVLNEQKRAAADDFRKWLLDRDQQQWFQDYGFRNVLGEPGPKLGTASGLTGADPPPLTLPDASTVTSAQRSWSTWRKPANVLLVMDSSGSMNDAIPEGSAGPPRLDAVRTAAEKALDSPVGLGPGDELAMWTFSSATVPTGAPYRQVVPGVPVPPAVPARGEPVGSAVPAVKGILDNLAPGGGTALYRTTRDAVAAVRDPRVYRPDRINAVVLLTDGAESVETAGTSDRSVEARAVAQTLAAVSPSAGPPVRVFYIAYSPDAAAARENLSLIAQRTGGIFYDATDTSKIDGIFADVVSNF